MPEQIALVEGTCMTLEHLPVLEDSGVYEFAGWYFNDKKNICRLQGFFKDEFNCFL